MKDYKITHVFIGSKEIPAKILEPSEVKGFKSDYPNLVVTVPEMYRFEFETRLYTAIRKLAGRATNAISPFITDVHLHYPLLLYYV